MRPQSALNGWLVFFAILPRIAALPLYSPALADSQVCRQSICRWWFTNAQVSRREVSHDVTNNHSSRTSGTREQHGKPINLLGEEINDSEEEEEEGPEPGENGGRNEAEEEAHGTEKLPWSWSKTAPEHCQGDPQ